MSLEDEIDQRQLYNVREPTTANHCQPTNVNEQRLADISTLTNENQPTLVTTTVNQRQLYSLRQPTNVSQLITAQHSGN